MEHIYMSHPICLKQPPLPPLTVIHINSDLVTTLEFWPDGMVVIKDHFSFHSREKSVGFYSNEAVNKFFVKFKRAEM